MKRRGIIGILLLGLILIIATSCGSDDQETTGQQPAEGDINVTITADGNIEASLQMGLTFGSGGKVDKIYVEEGDDVNKGNVLAKLDTSALELAVTQAMVARTQAEIAITQAQINLDTAEYNLEKARDLYIWPDINSAQADVDEAEKYLDEALWKLKYVDKGTESEEYWQKAAIHAQQRLNAAKDKLDAMLSGADPEEVAIEKLQVEFADQSLKLAQQSLEHARKQLAKATLTAPFGGMVASVSADVGDTVLATVTITHLVDLASMELKVEVDEIDVPSVKVGQRVIIELDALPDIQLEGRVSNVSPVAREQTGLVLYGIKIGFDIPRGSEIRVGMSATADIVLDERSDVLLVPNRAIIQDSQGNTVVEVIDNELVEERAVIIGISDGFETEVIDGLEEGDIVVEKRTRSQTAAPGLF